MNHKKSNKIWNVAQNYMPGGVNSPVRAFKSVDMSPIVIASAETCYLKDVDNNKYIDFLNGWGPLILGHSHKKVVSEIVKQASKGICYGAITEYELELAQLIVDNIKHIEKIRFVNSGTEAVMTALRLARGITQRSKIIKFDGCYHGHVDSMLVKSGSGLITKKNVSSNSDGLPPSSLQETLVLPLDNEELLEKCFKKYGTEIAAVIIEPLPANSGLLPQRIEFLKKIQSLCTEHKVFFILDEVITGFRLDFGGFAQKYNLKPDLVTFGKIIGGGMPIGAVAGKNKYLSQLAPEGNIYQAGTLSGNPLAMKAGLATLQTLLSENVYEHLQYLSNKLHDMFITEIQPIIATKSYNLKLIQNESIFWLNFNEKNNNDIVRDVNNIWKKSAEHYKIIFNKMIEKKIYIAPSAYEVGFLSYPMQDKHIEQFIKTLKGALK